MKIIDRIKKNLSYKVLYVCKFNDHEAIVLNKYPEIKYERVGQYLFGTDENRIFCKSFGYEAPCGRFKAFAGREFNIPMKDGTFTKANGQWWDSGHKKLEEWVGDEIVPITFEDLAGIKRCFVFTGALVFKKEYDRLRKSYKGKVYDYDELRKTIQDLT